MSARILLPRWITLCFFLVAPAAHAAGSPPRPNILYFYVDDMGWGAIGPNGQAERRARGLPTVRTPNLDRLAAQGVNFTRGYGCHVCSPARSSQQSGFHQGHTFADRNDPDNAKKAMRADDILMGDALSGAGYTTGYWGKWGYGASKDLANPIIQNIQTLPTSHGYQHVLAELHHVRAHTFFQPTLWRAPAGKNATGGLELIPNTMTPYLRNASYPKEPAWQDHPDYPGTAYCDDLYSFAALDFVRINATKYRETGRPFFGLLAVQIPHAPFDEITRLPNWQAAYRKDKHFADLPAQAQQWAAMVTRIDAHFGNILAALDDPNHDGDKSDSVADNTLVIFQSDNGGPGGPSNKVFDANGGLRGNKGSIHEGGIRVPLVMRWPARIHQQSAIKAGANVTRVVDVTDLLPTFCELAGTPPPLGIDGVSIAPTLTGSGRQRPRDFIIHEAGNGQSIIRGKHKLIRSAPSPGRKGKRQVTRESYALYDLEGDHAEAHDISERHPEVVAALKPLLLDERVTEPKGFANTYHHWTGPDAGLTSDPAHWSDYSYVNAGTTHLSDDGPPRLSWTALIENSGPEPRSALARSDLEVLGLEIRGSGSGASQTLEVGKEVTLTGRNEIRISRHGNLSLKGGTVSTLRWVEVAVGGKLSGHGRIDGALFHHGTLAVTAGLPLEAREFHATADALIRVNLTHKAPSPLRIRGEARLDGRLVIHAGPNQEFKRGAVATLLTASKLVGRFIHAEDRIADNLGNRYAIGYTPQAVTLTALD